MSFTLVISLVGLLLLLVIGLNVIQQQREKVERARRQELAKQRAIIDETEQLLALAPLLPYSNQLLMMLYQRIADAVKKSQGLAADDSEWKRRQFDVDNQISALKDKEELARDPEAFTIPSDDKKILAAVQGLKLLKRVVESEYNRSRLQHDAYVQENQRVDTMQLKINATVLYDRARQALQQDQVGSAKQLLAKLIAVLTPAHRDKFDFARHLVEQANELLNSIHERQRADLHELTEPEMTSDLDELFQPKKKW